MLLGIDHVVIACPDVDEAAAVLERATGLRAGAGGRHERLGTLNRLVWLGDSYLELIGVSDRTLAARSWIGAPATRALEAGGGLATFALATDDVGAELDRLRGLGAQLEGPIDGERLRPDGRVMRWRSAVPPRLDPEEPPFLIEHDTSAAEWTPTERAERGLERHSVGGPVRLEALELPVDDVARVQGRYLRALGLLFRPSLAGHGSRDASVGGQTIRLVPRRQGAGSPVVRMRMLDGPGGPVVADVLGCRFRIEPAG